MYIKLNFQLSEAGENSPLEPYKNKREAQRHTGWSLEDCISVNEKALCTHLPRHGKYLLTYRWNYFIGNTERQAIHGGDGREGGDSHEDLVLAQRALVVSLKRCSLQAALISAQMAIEHMRVRSLVPRESSQKTRDRLAQETRVTWRPSPLLLDSTRPALLY